MKIDIKKIKDIELLIDLKKICSYMKKSGVKMRYLVYCLIFSFGLTLFSMYTVSLLFPLAQGIIQGNFSNVKTMAVVGNIVAKFPHFFANSSTKLFLLLVFWVYFTIIIKNILQYGAFLSTQYQAKVSTTKLRELLLEKFLTFDKKFYDNNTVAYLHEILAKSTSAIETQFNLLQQFLIQMLLLLVYLAIMIHISWKLTIISVVVFPVVSLFTKKITKKVKKMSLEYSALSVDLSNKALNLLYCMPLVKGYAKEEMEKEIFSKSSREELESSFKMQKITNLVPPIQDIGTTTGILLVAIGMAWILGFDHSLTASGALIFFYLAMKIIPGLDALNNFKLGMAGAAGKVKQIEYVLQDSDLFVSKEGSKIFGGLEKSIEIKNLNFAYNDDDKNLILKDVSLEIEKGKTTAIVGPTGSGKSTLVNLLLRFYDCPAGSIFFDGEDVRNFNLKSLRSHMSFVSQDNFLFNETIKYNICYSSDGQVSDEKFKDIISKTLVSDFAEKLPKKYETVVGDRGVKLSGGEKQRVAMARALIKEPEILIMDEATSALDSNTENKISQIISEFTKGKTVVIIAHRLSTIKNADKVIYLENGKVLETGNLEQVIAQNGLFAKQWQAQKI